MVLINEENGFRRTKFTITNSLPFYFYPVEIIASSTQVGNIYTDLYKVLDKVDHFFFLTKLSLRDPLLLWFSSNRCERSQLERIDKFVSNIINKTSKFPQGGHLSALFFFIFTNDLDKCFHSC